MTTRAILIITSLFCFQAYATAADVPVQELAKPFRIPPGAPRHSDVGMRLFGLRGKGVNTADNMIKAGRTFHITRAEWSYIKDEPLSNGCARSAAGISRAP